MLSLAGCSDFARHYFRNLGWCLFLELLRCFSSPGSPPPAMYSLRDTFRWVSPFGNLRIKAYLPAPRSLSQAITSFVAYHCQGIQHMLLFTWPYNFELFFKSISVITRNVLRGLSPRALCRNESPYLHCSFHYNTNMCSILLKFKTKFKFVLTQSKNYVANHCARHGLY